MSLLTQDEILSIIEQLPGARRSSEFEIACVESALAVKFPPTYRRMLLAAGHGLCSVPEFLTLPEIQTSTSAAAELLCEAECDFCLGPGDVVFAWFEIYAFYYFASIGSDDVPVYVFDYNSHPESPPKVFAQSVPQGLAMLFRKVLASSKPL